MEAGPDRLGGAFSDEEMLRWEFLEMGIGLLGRGKPSGNLTPEASVPNFEDCPEAA